MTWAEYAAAWSALHGGFDADKAPALIRGWLRLAWRGGSALTRLHLGPNAVTAIGLLFCAAVPVAVLAGIWGLFLGGVLVLLAAFADGLDGAVAVISGKASRLGFVLDSVADRLGEAAWLVALWLAGAPTWLTVTCGAVSWLHEYLRARATAAGMHEIGVVTVGERPTRVSVTVSALTLGGAAGLIHTAWAALVVDLAGAAWLTLALIGLAQLAAAVRKQLAAS